MTIVNSVKSVDQQVSDQLNISVSDERLVIKIGETVVANGDIYWDDEELCAGYSIDSTLLSEDVADEMVSKIDSAVDEFVQHIQKNHKVNLDGLSWPLKLQ